MAIHSTNSVLVLVDVINAFDFEGSEGLVRAAARAAPKIEALAARAREERVPVVYVNDNFGRWRSDFASTIDACMAPDQPGRAVTARLRPHERDYFVLKPQHSGFYCTTLEPLLRHLSAESVVVTGFATNLCVLFTANDAYMRGYRLIVPSDCTAANTAALTRAALEHMGIALNAAVLPSEKVVLSRPRVRRGRPRAIR
jgi:nicotinamidase-related amidase